MKKILIILLIVFIPALLSAQFDNLDRKLEKKINNRIERKIDQGMDKGLDKTENAIEDAVKGEDNSKKDETTSSKKEGDSGSSYKSTKSKESSGTNANTSKENESIFSYSTEFDFVPGNKIMVLDNFSREYLGDFPSAMNTNGSGEIVKLSGSDEKWLKLRSSSTYIPDIPYPLPDNYTIEFDLTLEEISTSKIRENCFLIILDDNNTFTKGKNFGEVKISVKQHLPNDIFVLSCNNDQILVNNKINVDLRQLIQKQPHVSISVNKQRFRLWLNEIKYIDIPRFLPEGKIHYFKFMIYDFNEEAGEHALIGNLKIAEGGEDLRSKLAKDGRISTNGILFTINSDIVKPESYGIIRSIAQVMENDEAIKLQIVGHTDSDGDDKSNLELSKRRAEAVKKILVSEFKIDAGRLTVDGKGETTPVAPNDTPINKASNRRVEFIVI